MGKADVLPPAPAPVLSHAPAPAPTPPLVPVPAPATPTHAPPATFVGAMQPAGWFHYRNNTTGKSFYYNTHTKKVLFQLPIPPHSAAPAPATTTPNQLQQQTQPIVISDDDDDDDGGGEEWPLAEQHELQNLCTKPLVELHFCNVHRPSLVRLGAGTRDVARVQVLERMFTNRGRGGNVKIAVQCVETVNNSEATSGFVSSVAKQVS